MKLEEAAISFVFSRLRDKQLCSPGYLLVGPLAQAGNAIGRTDDSNLWDNWDWTVGRVQAIPARLEVPQGTRNGLRKVISGQEVRYGRGQREGDCGYDPGHLGSSPRRKEERGYPFLERPAPRVKLV